MQQINNDYASCYYLTESGEIYNSSTETYLKPNEKHSFRLKRVDDTYKRVTLRELYFLVFGKRYCKDTIKNLDNEQWKPIERTDNVYWISDKGRVKSLANYEAIILKPNIINGYERVDIVQEGSRSSKLISRLVAAAFLLPPAALDMQLHHKNGIRTDNNKDNLVWLTPKQHKQEHLKIKQKEKENA